MEKLGRRNPKGSRTEIWQAGKSIATGSLRWVKIIFFLPRLGLREDRILQSAFSFLLDLVGQLSPILTHTSIRFLVRFALVSTCVAMIAMGSSSVVVES